MNIFILVSILLIMLLNIFDIVSTIFLLERDFQEMNPYVNFLMNKFGVLNGLLIAKVVPLILLNFIGFKCITRQLKKSEKITIVVSMTSLNLFYLILLYYYNFQHMLPFI